MKDRFEEVAEKCAGFYGFRYVGVREIAAILRESFPEPAPAEQGEGLKPLQDCIDELSRMIDRHNTRSLEDGSWKYDYGTVADAQDALNNLATRPQPEAKVVPMATWMSLGDELSEKLVGKKLTYALQRMWREMLLGAVKE